MTARAQLALHRVADTFIQELTWLMEPAKARPSACAWLTLAATETLDAFNSPTRGTPGTFGDHLYARESMADLLRSQLFGLMASCETMSRQLAPAIGEIRTALSKDLPNTVSTDFGVSRLIDYLRANIIETSRLAADLGLEVPRPSMAESVRSLLSVMAERFEGQSIEVRVPPYGAVQVGAFGQGPTHTRGTPPNLVETNPRVFFDLATARLTWARAIRTGQLRISGAHANETARMLPVFTVNNLVSRN